MVLLIIHFAPIFLFFTAIAANGDLNALQINNSTNNQVTLDDDDDDDEFALPPNDEARLIHRLIERYKGYGLARPVAQVEKPLEVSLLAFINEFLGIEELTGTMKVTATIIAQWQDDLLRWNPDEFNQLKAIPMRTKDVFLPTIVKDGNGGTQASIFMTGSGQNDRDINSMVWVDHTGLVKAKVTGPIVTACKLNLANFPFDEQICEFVYRAWRFNDKRLRLHQARGQKLSELVGRSTDVNINANANWMMTSMTSEVRTIVGMHENYSAVCYIVKTTRRSDYYTWNIILPSISMAVLLLATYFMPFGPERSMFSITLVLTMNIFQQALTSKLPQTAEVIPYVRQTTAQVMLGIFIAIQSAFVWWIAAKDRRSAVPKFLRFVVPELRRRLQSEDRAMNKALRKELSDYLLSGKQKDEEGGISVALSLHASRLSLGNKAGASSANNKLPSVQDVAEALKAEELLVWGDWIVVAQFCDIIALLITISSMIFLPIYFYRHRLVM